MTLQVTATIYAILIAFVIVDEYTQVGDTQAQVSSKAASLAVVYENSRAFPSPTAAEMRKASTRLRPGSRRPRASRSSRSTGEPDRSTDRQLEEMFRAVQANRTDRPRPSGRPTTRRSRALDEIVATRAKLIDSARADDPERRCSLLLVVIGLVVMAVATLLDTQHRGSHLFILSALALVIWLTLALVVSLDYPFSGLIRVTDTPIREFIDFRAAR